jgi:hypothetical protein
MDSSVHAFITAQYVREQIERAAAASTAREVKNRGRRRARRVASTAPLAPGVSAEPVVKSHMA